MIAPVLKVNEGFVVDEGTVWWSLAKPTKERRDQEGCRSRKTSARVCLKVTLEFDLVRILLKPP